MHGNRDFLIGETFANEVGISILSDPYTLNINGLNVILSHGDFLCTDDVDYMDFRNMVRSEAWQKDFLSKNLDERNEIANSLRSTSKDATSKKSLEITDANPETINDFMQKISLIYLSTDTLTDQKSMRVIYLKELSLETGISQVGIFQ